MLAGGVVETGPLTARNIRPERALGGATEGFYDA